MTRFARGSEANKKKPEEASSWTELKKHDTKQKTLNDNFPKHSAIVRVTKKKQYRHEVDKKTLAKVSGKTQLNFDSDLKEACEVVRKDERREYRREKRITTKKSNQVCYNCRKTGHSLADCPDLQRDTEQGTGICFKCGSTEHSISRCRVHVPDGQYPYAKCFICGEMGHLSKQCPDNPRGLYPKGGCCKMCRSVEHYQKDCPLLQKQQGIHDVTVSTRDRNDNVEDDDSVRTFNRYPKTKKPKVVKF